MGGEKEGSRNGGGYVGGFFQLFDWTAKSRKKLFSNKSDLPVRPKQGKRSDGVLPMNRLNLMDEDENAAMSSFRGSSDYSCASSVTDDDGYGARPPGVVARLMGLDSMPTTSFTEPNSSPFFDTQSLREASQRRKHVEYYGDHQIMYSANFLNKEDGPSQTFLYQRPQKVLSRPIEKFRTEVLPPKSAKSIPVTRHKLLSPIKSPGFIPSKTTAHIMEAAARIIEPSIQSTTKTKISMVGSSSLPLKVQDLKEKLEGAQRKPPLGSTSLHLKTRDLKEKVEAPDKTSRLAEASRRPVESSAAKYLKGQPLNKSWNGSVETSFTPLPETEEGPSGLKNKGKSISLAIQAKANVQRREGLSSSGSRGLVGQKDHSQSMAGQTFRSQPNIQKSLLKRSDHNNGVTILRQNNQKQNCPVDKDKSSKPAVSNSQGRKTLTGTSSARKKISGKTVGHKTGSRKLSSDVTDSESGCSSYSTKHIPRKKRYIDGTLHGEKNRAVDNLSNDINQKDIGLSPIFGRHLSWAEESKRKGMDVVSFTFTAPLTRPVPGYEKSGQLAQNNSGACTDNRGKRLLLDTDSMKLSSIGYNVIEGDALSNLLEQKLRELTKTVESSSQNCVKRESVSTSALFLQDLTPSTDLKGNAPRLHNNKSQNMLRLSVSSYDSDAFSADPANLRLKHLFQGVDEMEESSSQSNDSRKLLDCRRPSPVSVLETSFLTDSSNSLDSTDCSSNEGRKQCSSIQAQEIYSFSSSNKLHYVDGDTELSDSASSTCNGITDRKHANTLPVTEPMKPTNWETEYVQQILSNLEFMFQDFALGRACEIINPRLFNQLEIRKEGVVNDGVESRLERKVMFDCVGEFLDIRCRRYVGGGYESWRKGVTMVRRKEWLAEEVLKEVLAWKGMGDCMVDELLDKEMSSQYGRWIDFEVDAFVVGTEIEGQIYNILLDEVVADIF